MRLEIVIDFVHLEDWWLSLSIATILILVTLRWDNLVATYRSWTTKSVAQEKGEDDDEDIIAAVRRSKEKQKDPLQALQQDFSGMLNGKPANMNTMFDNFFGVIKQVMDAPTPEVMKDINYAIEQEKLKTAQRAQWTETGGNKSTIWYHLNSKTNELESHQPTSAEIKALSPPGDQPKPVNSEKIDERLIKERDIRIQKDIAHIQELIDEVDKRPICDDSIINHVNPPMKTQAEIDKEFDASRDACEDDIKTKECQCEDGVCFATDS